MEKGFLYYYELWMSNGQLPYDGLCNSLPQYLTYTEAWKMVNPSQEELQILCQKDKPAVYWGGEKWGDSTQSLTPRRQNILLLAAALNGEL